MKKIIALILLISLAAGAYVYMRNRAEREELPGNSGREESVIAEKGDDALENDTGNAAEDGESGTEGKGTVEGEIGFPSEAIPAMEIYFFEKDNYSEFEILKTEANQGTFSIELEEGVYNAVAYDMQNPELSGSYTEAVGCGLKAECTDHTMINIVVERGRKAGGVEIRDWYAAPGTFPEKPQ